MTRRAQQFAVSLAVAATLLTGALNAMGGLCPLRGAGASASLPVGLTCHQERKVTQPCAGCAGPGGTESSEAQGDCKHLGSCCCVPILAILPSLPRHASPVREPVLVASPPAWGDILLDLTTPPPRAGSTL